MSDLRRRIFGVGTPDSTPSTSRDASPAPGGDKVGPEYQVIPKEKLEKLRQDVKHIKRKGTKRRNAWIFALGGAFGIFLAGFFASTNGNLERLVDMAGIRDLNVMDVLPAGLIRDVQDLQVCDPLYSALRFFLS